MLRKIIFLLSDDDLIIAIHVCHHWRMVFLSAPTLWSRIDFSQPEKSRVVLERACEAQIHIALGMEFDETTLGLLYNKVTQIISMDYNIRTLKTNWVIHPMPFLRELNIIGNGDLSCADKNLER